MDLDPLISEASPNRWSAEQAHAWYDALPWLTGCNFVPSCAINQLEMWQAETFNPAEIDRELGWLAALGMNSMRVFLHDLLWAQDRDGFLVRVDQFLDIAHRHDIGIMFVFFDSCWFPFPRLGPQLPPEPGVHNSSWVQSPRLDVVKDSAAFDKLEDYVTGFIAHYRNDPRIHAWDLWNEPDNWNGGSYGSRDLGARKFEVILPLLARVFRWARSAKPIQPLTSGAWAGFDPTDGTKFTLAPMATFQLAVSDVNSFHCYSNLQETQRLVKALQTFGRPLLCTEYMARGSGSTFQAIMPYFQREKIAAYNWGAVAGKSQTQYPWDSWQKPYAQEPKVWHHDIFRPDGSPYDPQEIELIKSLRSR